MTRISKIVALLAFLAASGCRDTFPVIQPPTDILYFPVGLAVRQVPDPQAPTDPARFHSQLAIANSNFDLRYDSQTGGSVVVVDPDTSPDTSTGQGLVPLGFLYTGSFTGEVALADAGCPPGWPDCPSACATLAADPDIAAGGARLVTASRSNQVIYRMSMDAAGDLTCGDGCAYSVPIQQLDPYGVAIVCSARTGNPVAYAFVSHLLAANNVGYLNRVNLAGPNGDVVPYILGANATYTAIYNPWDDLLFVTSSVAIDAQFRWFNPLTTPNVISGFALPDFTNPFFATFFPGAVARDMALSSDGRFLHVTVQLYDTVAARSGIFFTLGGALAVFDLEPSIFGNPSMTLLGVTPTCLGAGQIRRLPARAGKPDLFAITCDVEGALVLYDSSARGIVRYIGRGPDSGVPVLGRYPFGLAVEPVDPARAIVPPAGSGYDPSPCGPGRDCQRIYVGSFLDNWVNILELDPDRPDAVALVKRIGVGP